MIHLKRLAVGAVIAACFLGAIALLRIASPEVINILLLLVLCYMLGGLAISFWHR